MSSQLLEGMVIALTRSEDQAKDFAKVISSHGGVPYFMPLFRVAPISLSEANKILKEILRMTIHYVVFTSVNGVHFFISLSERLRLKDAILEKLRKAKIISIGPRTCEKLKEYGLKAEVPRKYCSDSLLEELKKREIKGKVIVLIRSNLADDFLERELEKLGADVRRYYFYKTEKPDSSLAANYIKDIINGRIQVLMFTSSSSVTHLFETAEKIGLIEELRKALREILVIAIGPRTKTSLETHGLYNVISAEEHSIRGMLNLLFSLKNLRRR